MQLAPRYITADEATQLLRAFKWNVNRVNDEWFQDEDEVGRFTSMCVCGTMKTYCYSAQRQLNS
jgi:hypothetical protein